MADRRSWGVWQHRVALVVFLTLIFIGAALVTWSSRYTIAIHRLRQGVGDTTFYAADGRPWFRMDEQRMDVPLSAISPELRQAVLAVEDHRFYHHFGIDPIGLARAVMFNIRPGRSVQGGSTLTQQLARMLYLSNERTYARKIKEAVLALMIERELTKDQILELYLNRVYLSAGVYGVQPLCLRLFGKPAKDVTVSEAALVAGLIRAPSALSPWSNLDGAITRSHVVLTRLREEGFITAAQERQARSNRLRIKPYPRAIEARAGYAKDYLRQQFRNQFGGDHPPDWKVQTTFLPELQDAAEQAVRNGLRRARNANLEAALVAIDPRTGNILALVGGHDYTATPFNRATKSRRQPGSAFKPFVYAAALSHGFSPVSVLTKLTEVGTSGPNEWNPQNAGGEISDQLTLRAALLQSDNRAAVSLQQRVGSDAVLRLASSVGIRNLPDVPSLALGTGLVTPLDLTTAFSVFPNGGFRVLPRGILNVVDADGDTAFEHFVEPDRVISPEVAFQMVSMLEDVMERGTGAGVKARGLQFPIGGKTGTTDDFKDAWFVGFSSSLVVGVWVGFDQPATIGQQAYGSRLALPIWSEFMASASRRVRPGEFPVPADLKPTQLCRVSYQQPLDGCPLYTEYFKDGDAIPSRLCTIHSGSLRQRTERAIEGILSGLGRRIAGIFRR